MPSFGGPPGGRPGAGGRSDNVDDRIAALERRLAAIERALRVDREERRPEGDRPQRVIGEKVSVVPKRGDPKDVQVLKADQCRKDAAPRLATVRIVRVPKPAVKAKGVVPKAAPLRKVADQTPANRKAGAPRDALVQRVVPAAKAAGLMRAVPVVLDSRPSAGPVLALQAVLVDLAVPRVVVRKVVVVLNAKVRHGNVTGTASNSHR